MGPTDPTSAEDAAAREMIERIAREVDLESGRVPRGDDEAEADETGASEAVDGTNDPVADPEERSEEDVSRELVERIAREVDEGRPG
jgi:hypothetical protein